MYIGDFVGRSSSKLCDPLLALLCPPVFLLNIQMKVFEYGSTSLNVIFVVFFFFLQSRNLCFMLVIILWQYKIDLFLLLLYSNSLYMGWEGHEQLERPPVKDMTSFWWWNSAWMHLYEYIILVVFAVGTVSNRKKVTDSTLSHS